MGKTCIAVDIGASSGRVIAGTLEDGRISLREIYRFKNGFMHIKGHDYWDIDSIFHNIKTGLAKLKCLHYDLLSVGIDTWAVDYVLLDGESKRVSPAFSYRDHRTDHTLDRIFGRIGPDGIYEKTGIQFQQFNTICQLFEHSGSLGQDAQKVQCFLMIPDYLNFLFSGVKSAEFTNATTTQLFNTHLRDWDADLISMTGFDKSIFPEVLEPGSILGSLTEEVRAETGLHAIKVIAPATHDTGSAVVSIPSTYEDFAYISSGTWSLMGIETKGAVCSEKAMRCNFTNEGGAYRTNRMLKNIMGLWLIQECQRIWGSGYSSYDLVILAEKSEPFKCLINPNDPRFLNPDNMLEEIKSYCSETSQPVPDTVGEISRCIFESLAFMYRTVLAELREIQPQEINRIHIIGGGSKNRLLDQLCADFTGCEVLAGPVEATALGNLAVQFITMGEIGSLKEARKIIADSFGVERYSPVINIKIEENWKRFELLLRR